jgi:hypothetical protein
MNNPINAGKVGRILMMLTFLFALSIGCDRSVVQTTSLESGDSAETRLGSIDLNVESLEFDESQKIKTESEESISGLQDVSTRSSIQEGEPGTLLPLDDSKIKSGETRATETIQEGEITPPVVQEPGMLEKAGDLFNKAKSKGAAAAAGTGKWVQESLGTAAESSSQAAEDTLNWATKTFNSLKEQGMTSATSTQEWLNDDWKNMDSWEYAIVELAGDDGEVGIKLNELGKKGWECFHIKDTKYYFKKPSHSYLRSLPFKDVIKLVPLMGAAGGGNEGR